MISVLATRDPALGGAPGRLWLRARSVADPVVVAVVALVVYALHGMNGYLDRDLGVFVYGGEQVARGIPPYRGIFNSVGPLADAVPGLGIKLGGLAGMDPVTSARWLFLLMSVGSVVVVAAIARETTGSRAAGFVAAAVFLAFPRFLQLASDGPREKTTMVLALLGCLLFLQRRRFFAAGVCTALATLTWQPVLAPAAVAAGAAVLLLPRRDRKDAVVGFLAGGALPSLLAMAWFAATGVLRTAIDGFLVINVMDTSQPSPLLDPVHSAQLLWHGYRAALLLVPVGLVALIVVAVRDRRRRVLAAGAVAATAWSAAVLNGCPDLFVVLPFVALGLADLVVLGVQRLPQRLGYGVLVAVVAGAVAVAGVESVTTRNNVLVTQRADVRAVLATQPSDAVVLSIETPQLLALAGRDNPTPYQIFGRPMRHYLRRTLPGRMAGYVRTIEALQPTWVAVGRGYRPTWPNRVLARHYWRVGVGPGWIWYLNRSAGDAALLRARAANDAVMHRPAPRLVPHGPTGQSAAA